MKSRLLCIAALVLATLSTSAMADEYVCGKGTLKLTEIKMLGETFWYMSVTDEDPAYSNESGIANVLENPGGDVIYMLRKYVASDKGGGKFFLSDYGECKTR